MPWNYIPASQSQLLKMYFIIQQWKVKHGNCSGLTFLLLQSFDSVLKHAL